MIDLIVVNHHDPDAPPPPDEPPPNEPPEYPLPDFGFANS